MLKIFNWWPNFIFHLELYLLVNTLVYCNLWILSLIWPEKDSSTLSTLRGNITAEWVLEEAQPLHGNNKKCHIVISWHVPLELYLLSTMWSTLVLIPIKPTSVPRSLQSKATTNFNLTNWLDQEEEFLHLAFHLMDEIITYSIWNLNYYTTTHSLDRLIT